MKKSDYLPISVEDIANRGWDQLDFVYVIGDAYVDHPSFGHAIISRVLEKHGYKVGIISQPDWRSTRDFKKLGKPRLAFLVSAGNIDSMVNHYTVNKKKRSTDAYSPGNKAGRRPDRATIVYCNRIKEAFKEVPILIGGVEASLRRFAHYDYWDDTVRRSILFDSRADLLMYGMGERQIVEIADKLRDGIPVNRITDVAGTCYIADLPAEGDLILPSYEECKNSKEAYAISCKVQYYEQNPYIGKVLAQKHGDKFLIQNKPQKPLTTSELDNVYSLGYMRNYHPVYESEGGVPAIDEVKFSITANRGCYGGCNFCALAFHQGRIVTSRSVDSIVKEAKLMTTDPEFKGYIHDVGGPTANFTAVSCERQKTLGACKNKQCLFPEVCKNMKVSHEKYLNILRALRKIDGVKKVFIRSGIRFDYLMADRDDTFFYELCEYHISGQLKVAPEHISDNVLKHMGKPSPDVFNKFREKFYRINEKIGKKQYLVPYLMSSHPGSTIHDAVRLAQYLNAHHINPQQVQDFYPTPGTVSTCMFYTGIDPFTMKKVYVPKTYKEKNIQRALLQYRDPANYRLVHEALVAAGRDDLIGYSGKCLIRPSKDDKNYIGRNHNGKTASRKGSISKDKGRAEGRGRSAEKKRNSTGARGRYSR